MSAASQEPRRSLSGHVRIMRFDHWFKNVFVLPGIVLAWYFYGSDLDWTAPVVADSSSGCSSMSLVASSNYVINEILDAPFDLASHQASASGAVGRGSTCGRVRAVDRRWCMAGLALAVPLGWRFFVCAFVAARHGLLYNVRPFRSKDCCSSTSCRVDQQSHPLLAGWYIADRTHASLPLSLLLSYWMIGCYFMALKRYSEYRSDR